MKHLVTAAAIVALFTSAALADGHANMTFRDGRTVEVAPVYGTALVVDPNYTVEGYTMMTGEMTADDLDDVSLYSTISGEEIGEIEDVLIQDGKITGYVLEVGGFLDIGDAEVAVKADQVMMMRNADGDLRAYVNATEEQLEDYPKYDYAD